MASLSALKVKLNEADSQVTTVRETGVCARDVRGNGGADRGDGAGGDSGIGGNGGAGRGDGAGGVCGMCWNKWCW